MSESLASRLSDVVLPNLENDPVRLGSLWQSQPAVIVFLRHYG